jgi:hypothetical protein
VRNKLSGKKSSDTVSENLTYFKAPLIYALVYCVVLVISLFRESYSNFSFLEQASFRGSDEPWLPSGLIPEPVLGKHFFGDFYLPFRFVTEANPYFPENIFNNILPFGQISYQILSVFRVNDAFYVYTFLALYIFSVGVKNILFASKRIGSVDAYLLSVFIILFSFPIITAVDRGANVLLVAGIMCVAVAMLMKENISRGNQFTLVLLLAYSISAKIYLLPLLIFVWIFYSKKVATQTLLLTIFLNVLFSFQFGGPIQVFRQLELSFRTSSASANPDLLFGSLSQSGLLAQILKHLGAFPENQYLITAIGFLPGFVLLCAIIMICKFLQLSFVFVLVLSLSCFQYMTPVSYVYTGVWASISIALLASAKMGGLAENEKVIFPFLYFGVCTQLLPIHIFEQYRLLIPFCWFLTISIVLWIAISFRYKIYFPRKSEAETGH